MLSSGGWTTAVPPWPWLCRLCRRHPRRRRRRWRATSPAASAARAVPDLDGGRPQRAGAPLPGAAGGQTGWEAPQQPAPTPVSAASARFHPDRWHRPPLAYGRQL